MNIDELVKESARLMDYPRRSECISFLPLSLIRFQATMKVDERNRQPFGFLSGGASLALAENVAGIGSWRSVRDRLPWAST